MDAVTAEVQLIAVRVERCLSRQFNDRVQQIGIIDESMPITQCQHAVRQIHVLVIVGWIGVGLEDALLFVKQSIKQNPDIVAVEEVQLTGGLDDSLCSAPVTVHQHYSPVCGLDLSHSQVKLCMSH